MPQAALHPEKWVDKYANYLLNYTLVRINDREMAKDLISETFLSALKALKNFKGESSERTWLISILKRKIIDYYRKTNSAKGQAEVKVEFLSEDREGEWLEERVAAPQDKNIENDLANQELKMAIVECLGQLSERQERIFTMKTIEEIDTETICNEFNITPSNLWVIIHRARAALANCLEKKGYN